MDNKRKLLITFIIIASVICLIVGATFAYFSWYTSSEQESVVEFTLSAGFSCSANGGGNLNNNNMQLVPADCTNTTYAVKRTVKLSTVQDTGKTIYLDLKLKVNSLDSGLANSENFRYSLNKNSSNCHYNVVSEGNFLGATTNTEIPLFTNEKYTVTTSNETYYLWIWLDKAETNPNTQDQKFNISLVGSCTDQEAPVLTAPWGEEVDRYTRIDFSQSSTTDNTSGLYLYHPTANDTNPVYYYRGDVSNNNVFFGGYCWKIVRTTETGGTKLIYNGDDDGEEHCTNTTGADTRLASSSKFYNLSGNASVSDIGFMLGVRYPYTRQTAANMNNVYLYGNDVSYDGTNYHLIDTYTSTGAWSTDYKNLNNYHYTCRNTTGVCSSVYYLFYNTSSYAYYITLTDGKTVDIALDEMIISPSNANSSTIKNSLNTWYNSNLTSYASYLEDAVWCSDRTIYSYGAFKLNGSLYSSSYGLYFPGYGNYRYYASPKVKCPRVIDSFTVSNANGNGALSGANPIGLLTVDEVMLAGAKYSVANDSFYLYTAEDYWLITPYSYYNGIARGIKVGADGIVTYENVNTAKAVRPAISLKPGLVWSGSGTSTSPYKVSLS